MIKLNVLQLTDAKGYEQNYYSRQHDVNVKMDIEAGAVIKNIFYVDDNNFSEHSDGFNPKGVWGFVEYAEKHGVIFEKETDAIKYEKYISLIKDKIKINGYEVIEKDNAIKIIEGTSIEELADLLLSKQIRKKCGSVCYLDLEDGMIKVVEDTHSLIETDIVICDLDVNWMFEGCIVNGEYIKDYEVSMLSSLLELGAYGQAIEKFYT